MLTILKRKFGYICHPLALVVALTSFHIFYIFRFGVLSKYLHDRYNIHTIKFCIGKYRYGGDADTEKAKTCEH